MDVVSKNGCMLLNVGPKADGTITEEETEVLLQIGSWLQKNGEGIYGTTFWKTYGEGPTQVPEGHFSDTSRPPYTDEDIRYTYKNGAVYAFLMRPSAKGQARLTAFATPANGEDDLTFKKVTLLGSAEPVSFTRDTSGLQIRFQAPPASTPCPLCFKLILE